MLPEADRLIYTGQNLMENGKIQNFKGDIFGDFQRTVTLVSLITK